MTDTIIHLAFQRLLIEKFYMQGSVIDREDVLSVMMNRLKFKNSTYFRNKLIDEMIQYGLLEKVDRFKLRIINQGRSGGLEGLI